MASIEVLNLAHIINDLKSKINRINTKDNRRLARLYNYNPDLFDFSYALANNSNTSYTSNDIENIDLSNIEDIKKFFWFLYIDELDLEKLLNILNTNLDNYIQGLQVIDKYKHTSKLVLSNKNSILKLQSYLNIITEYGITPEDLIDKIEDTLENVGAGVDNILSYYDNKHYSMDYPKYIFPIFNSLPYTSLGMKLTRALFIVILLELELYDYKNSNITNYTNKTLCNKLKNLDYDEAFISVIDKQLSLYSIANYICYDLLILSKFQDIVMEWALGNSLGRALYKNLKDYNYKINYAVDIEYEGLEYNSIGMSLFKAILKDYLINTELKDFEYVVNEYPTDLLLSLTTKEIARLDILLSARVNKTKALQICKSDNLFNDYINNNKLKVRTTYLLLKHQDLL